MRAIEMSLGETDDESVSAGTSPPGIKSRAILLSLYNLTNQRWILKKLFCLAASPKSVMVATNSAPNIDLEDYFSS